VAVVQISRIQIRRGQKNQGEGLPQLASGELAWAIDSQELYIGNGSVIEGAPAVGNTKILTQSDDLFSLADTYSYKKDFPYIETGSSSTNPFRRTLQDRLDDTVSIRSFGATGDANQDATDIIQKAIDMLFINPSTVGNEQSRVILTFEPGVYTVNRTIYIPPYATIVGAGKEKTIISSTASTIIRTVNGSSIPGSPALDDNDPNAATTSGNQPRVIQIKSLTLSCNQAGIGIHLASCRDSLFEDIDIIGNWNFGTQISQVDPFIDPTDTGIFFDSLSRSIKTQNNNFSRCKVANWSHGVILNNNSSNNNLEKISFIQLGEGINIGTQVQNDANLEVETPDNNSINNSYFYDIHDRAINLKNGKGNYSHNNFFRNVGNSGSNELDSTSSIIHFEYSGNESKNDYFYRTAQLAKSNFNSVDVPYTEEISGSVAYTGFLDNVVIPASTEPINILKLPGQSNQSYILEYLMHNGNAGYTRSGTLIITCDVTLGRKVDIIDDYTFLGDPNFDIGDNYLTYDITFSAEYVNDGSELNPKYSIYLKTLTGNQISGTTYLRYKLNTNRYLYHS